MTRASGAIDFFDSGIFAVPAILTAMNLLPLPRTLRLPLLFTALAITTLAANLELLPFPDAVATTAPALDAALRESVALNPWLGGYPPRIRDAQERQAIYARWQEALAGARALQRKQGDTESVLLLLGRLYRQGHNLDVRRCGQEAVTLFDRALAQFPDSPALLLEASYLYLSIHPKFAPQGEAALLKLRRIRGTDRDPEIERGLIFAYLYQNRLPEAKAQIDRCLALNPKDKMLLDFREALKKPQNIDIRTDATMPPAKP